MAGKHYINEVDTDIVVDCGCDISAATDTVLKVKKPDGTEVEWAASIYDTNYLKYTAQAGDLSPAGRYLLQSSLVLAGWTGRGETASFIIYEHFK